MKLTTKLLLGATVVAGLSISAFAACATDVELGVHKIKTTATTFANDELVTKAYVDGKTQLAKEVYSIPYSADGDVNMTISSLGNHIRVHLFSYQKMPYIIECSGHTNPVRVDCVTLSDGMSGSVSAVSPDTLNIKWSGAWGNSVGWRSKVIVYK